MILAKLKEIHNYIRKRNDSTNDMSSQYEFCPRCEANLTLQKGYSNELPYWICKGCGEMLINPEVDSDSNIAWICDGCGAMLNIQQGFNEECAEWTCAECGFVNKISASEVYSSEDEYQAEQMNPYKGLSDEEVLQLSLYIDEEHIDGRGDIIRVRHRENGDYFIKKLLTTYNRSVYDYLRDNPIAHMPRVFELYESDNCLIVIEESIEGVTIADILEQGALPDQKSIHIAREVCKILDTLHNLPTPIIHRDVKPSNIIINPDDEVYLLDMNVAKWFDPDKTDDTRYMGTKYFAAPEQVGYGLSASSAKSDIYAMGILLNVMLTGKFPKEERAEGKIWGIIERCISLEAKERYTAMELMKALDSI